MVPCFRKGASTTVIQVEAGSVPIFSDGIVNQTVTEEHFQPGTIRHIKDLKFPAYYIRLQC